VILPELMAWFGWKTIGEAQRYIEEASRIKLAESAAAEIMSRTGIVKLAGQFDKTASNSLKS
jgi:hypothetical protein